VGSRGFGRARGPGERLSRPAIIRAAPDEELLIAAYDVGRRREVALDPQARRRGAHYTPSEVARTLADIALDHWRGGAHPRVVDPMCGGGVFLLAVADALVDRGMGPTDALASVHGSDLDGEAVAASVEGLRLWAAAHGLDLRSHNVECRDGFDTLAEGWDIVIGNPPFRGQLRSDTVHDAEERAALRGRFGEAATGYVDVAWLVALASVEALVDGGVCVLVQPRSIVAAAHGASVRSRISRMARLSDLWVPPGRVFVASVEVCAPVLVRTRDGETGTRSWASRLAAADGVPGAANLDRGQRSVGDVATVVAGFRDQYYGLVGHVRDAERDDEREGLAPLVTSGLIAPGRNDWGEVGARFAKRRWERPVVDTEAAARARPPLSAWFDLVRQPKVLVASQTRVVEAVSDPTGWLVPVTPVISVIPAADNLDPVTPEMITAALSAPVVSLWLQHRLAGSGMSSGAMRVSAGELAGLPLPTDAVAWEAASALLARGIADESAWARFGRLAEAAYEVEGEIDWWLTRVVAASGMVIG